MTIIDWFQVNYTLSKECNITDEVNDIASWSLERSAFDLLQQASERAHQRSYVCCELELPKFPCLEV